MEIMKLTIKEDFHGGTCYLFSFSYHKITLFEKKYVIKLCNYFNFDVPLKTSCKGAVRNYQGGRVANNRGRVMIFCALKKGGLQFFQLSLR